MKAWDYTHSTRWEGSILSEKFSAGIQAYSGRLSEYWLGGYDIRFLVIITEVYLLGV